MKNIRRIFSGVLVFSLLISTLFVLPIGQIEAAAVAVTVSAPSNAEFDALTDTDVTFGYTTSASEFATSDTITVTISPALNSALTDCAAPTDDADGDVTTDGAFGSFTTTGAVYTFTQATTTASTGGIDLCLNFQNDTATGNYSISIVDSNDNDFGAALIYVGDDNDVTVTATVTPSLAFAIRNSADTADTNVCALGTLTIAAVNTCAYRLKVTTNADNGFTINILSDGDLRKSGSGDVADSEDIDPVTEDTTVTAGTEDYGIAVTGGSVTGGTMTESGNFNDDDTPIPTGSTAILSSDGANNPGSTDTTNTSLITHRAAVDGDTGTGNYSQIVTYRVTASF